MVTKLQILEFDNFKNQICKECSDINCNKSYEDIENCF